MDSFGLLKQKAMKQSATKTFILPIAAIFLLILLCNRASAQARFQSDVSISTITVVAAPVGKQPPKLSSNVATSPKAPAQQSPLALDANLKCTIVVHNENDDDAHAAMLLVILPVEVSIISVPANCTVYKAGGTSPLAAYLVFNLGNMAVQQNITLEFTFTKSQFGNKVGAYAYSASPDPNPANNYKDVVYN